MRCLQQDEGRRLYGSIALVSSAPGGLDVIFTAERNLEMMHRLTQAPHYSPLCMDSTCGVMEDVNGKTMHCFVVAVPFPLDGHSRRGKSPFIPALWFTADPKSKAPEQACRHLRGWVVGTQGLQEWIIPMVNCDLGRQITIAALATLCGGFSMDGYVQAVLYHAASSTPWPAHRTPVVWDKNHLGKATWFFASKQLSVPQPAKWPCSSFCFMTTRYLRDASCMEAFYGAGFIAAVLNAPQFQFRDGSLLCLPADLPSIIRLRLEGEALAISVGWKGCCRVRASCHLHSLPAEMLCHWLQLFPSAGAREGQQHVALCGVCEWGGRGGMLGEPLHGCICCRAKRQMRSAAIPHPCCTLAAPLPRQLAG